MATQKTRWALAAQVFISCLLLGGTGAVISGVGPMWASHTATDALAGGGASDQSPGPGPPILMTQELPRTVAPTLGAPGTSRLARYDNIMVEVNQDGRLCVLGEEMGVDAFRALLRDQLRIQLQTVVTIEPDANCPFRHVGSVLAVCEEAGVLHRTQYMPAAVSISGPAAGPSSSMLK